MCSIVLKILFLTFLIGGAVLVAISLGKSQWRQHDFGSYDLFKECYQTVAQNGTVRHEKCQDTTWDQWAPWHRAVVLLLAIALFIFLFAFGWWLLACIGCCCQNFLVPPLPFLALLCAMLTAAAVITYACSYGGPKLGDKAPNSSYGWAFWCAVAGAGSFALAALIGLGLMAWMRTRAEDRHEVVYKHERAHIVRH